VEAIRVLATVYELTAHDQATAIEMLLNHRDLVLQESETVTAALELFRAKPGLNFSDCFTFYTAQKAGHHPLGTFDRNLAKVAGTQKL
jgi:predicted nucleic-acid-binding protein